MIPEDVAKFKPCSSVRIRNDNGTYRVYRYHAIKLPSGKWSSNYGDLIGKIIPGVGFIPNKRYRKELGDPSSDEVTDVAYGQYALLEELSRDVHEKLCECFEIDVATQIYAYALILCVNGSVPLEHVEEIYQESYLSIAFQGIPFRMDAHSLYALIQDLSNATHVKEFELFASIPKSEVAIPQDCHASDGLGFILLVADVVKSRLDNAVGKLGKPSIQSSLIMLKARRMRMVKGRKGWSLHNAKAKDLEFFKEMGFIPKKVIHL